MLSSFNYGHHNLLFARTKMRKNACYGEDAEMVKPPEAVADAIAALLDSEFETWHRMRVD